MKQDLKFLTNYISESVIDSKIRFIKNAFKSDDCFDDVPDVPGIYIMVARDQSFVYPKNKSHVFYIGTSKHLKTRLKNHLRLYKEADMDFKKHSMWIYSRYNYAVAFGADIYYMRITGCESERTLERKAIEGFFDKYGALPVGNGAFTYCK